MYEDPAAWQSTIEKGIRSVFPGIKKVVVLTGNGCCQPDEGLAGLMEGMKSIKAEELLLECEDWKLLVVKYDYGEAAAAVYYEHGISPADLSRLIQLMFARRDLRASDKSFLPAVQVETLVKRWKRRIGIVFGEEFASNLVETSLKGKDKNTMTADDMEGVRASVSAALGDCLVLDKVNK